MRVIIAGSRDITDYEFVKFAIRCSGFKITEVVSGCATGVDRLGERWAAENDVAVMRFPADWKTHGKAAGAIRNRRMAEYGAALIAVHDGSSRGTQNMIDTASSWGLNSMAFVYPGPGWKT